ncbi:hypothetical protein HK104_006744, partial [Borealophlyctis nickersoniae]
IDVQIEFFPNTNPTEYATTVKFNLNRKIPDYDIFMLDVVWPSEIGEHFVDLTQYLKPTDYASHIADILAPDWVGGRLGNEMN